MPGMPGNQFTFPNRGPISIFGPIFKVEDRAEDPDLRIIQKPGGGWSRGGRKPIEKAQEGGRSSFFRPRKSKIGGSSLFEPGRSKNPSIVEESPIFEEVAPPSRLPLDLLPILRSRKSKMGGVLLSSASMNEDKR